MIVLDSSAILAFLFEEPGGAIAAEEFPAGLVSAASLAEILGRLARDDVPLDRAFELFRSTSVRIEPFDSAQALAAAALLMPARTLQIGLGDCCAIGLAVVRNCPILTGDRTWRDLALPIEVRLIR